MHVSAGALGKVASALKGKRFPELDLIASFRWIQQGGRQTPGTISLGPKRKTPPNRSRNGFLHLRLHPALRHLPQGLHQQLPVAEASARRCGSLPPPPAPPLPRSPAPRSQGGLLPAAYADGVLAPADLRHWDGPPLEVVRVRLSYLEPPTKQTGDLVASSFLGGM